MTSAARASRERTRLLTAAKRARGKRSRAALRIARDVTLLAELADELKAAEAGLAELDAEEAER